MLVHNVIDPARTALDCWFKSDRCWSWSYLLFVDVLWIFPCYSWRL